MRQFDVFENPSPTMRTAVPYVIVLSSHLVPGLTEVVVAPMVRSGDLEPSPFDLPVTVGNEDLIVSIIGLAAISGARLKHPVASAVSFEDDIRRALDRLFTGF